MKRRDYLLVLVLVAMVLIAGGCTSELGLGEADCSPPTDHVSSSNVMTVQAVPTAKYTPCLNDRLLGWDSVEWFAENGRAGIQVSKNFEPFLTATVTESCDTSDATAVNSTHPDIERFEDIQTQQADIEVVIVPSGEQPLATALQLVKELSGTKIAGRPLNYTIDNAIDDTINSRTEPALANGAYVFIIDELDVEESTVQLRSNTPTGRGRGLKPRDAIGLIELTAPGVFYRGNWYFTFDGGCITYDFDATGLLAETVADDSADVIGFYPAFELRDGIRNAGYNLG